MTIETINKRAVNSPEKFIADCEAKFYEKIKKVAERILEENIKFVFVSGPTSSGKTTFSKMLSNMLDKVHPTVISLDNFYKTMDEMPKKNDGEMNFESINSLKTDEIHETLSAIQENRNYFVPALNFENRTFGEKNEYTTKENAVYIIEGLHALNSKICNYLSNVKALKIYIYPEFEPISKYDIRFIRRMVRDNFFRNSDVFNSLEMWNTVRDGEKIYSSKYEKNSDITINTFLPYEMCVFKHFALEELNKVDNTSKHYNKVVRLKKILTGFSDIDYKLIPEDSLLNEFIKQDSPDEENNKNTIEIFANYDIIKEKRSKNIMEWFENVKDTVKETAGKAVEKSNQLIDITKLNFKVSDLKSDIEKTYKAIGLKIFEDYKSGEATPDEIAELCKLIEENYEKIEALKSEIADIKNMKKCPECGKYISADSSFCSDCGAKAD
ncbi:MAG: hypothetical protein IJC74_00390 [Clostridia bacterium]|nr:hypothetical protein [Clostridia bacterium]